MICCIMAIKITLEQIVIAKLNLKAIKMVKIKDKITLGSVVTKLGATTLTITQQGLASSTARTLALN